jgi:REP element-mobilizing transposase RayT
MSTVLWKRMARLRKRHLQQSFAFREPGKDGRGGKRPRAGRPPKGRRSSEPHKRRPSHDRRHPVHATMRVVPGLGSLRKRDTYLAIRGATIAVIPHGGFRIVHFSIQTNHIHLIAEASSKSALSRGMQAFQISAAKRINAALTARTGERRRGQVFADRYHARALTSPRAVRHAICYVLNNWRRHQEDRASFARSWKLDPYSNATDFVGWKERDHSPWLYPTPPTYLALITWIPKTWLLREGWKKHRLISIREVPGPQPGAAPRAKPTS